MTTLFSKPCYQVLHFSHHLQTGYGVWTIRNCDLNHSNQSNFQVFSRRFKEKDGFFSLLDVNVIERFPGNHEVHCLQTMLVPHRAEQKEKMWSWWYHWAAGLSLNASPTLKFLVIWSSKLLNPVSVEFSATSNQNNVTDSNIIITFQLKEWDIKKLK